LPEIVDRYSRRRRPKSTDEKARNIQSRLHDANWVGVLRQDEGSPSPEQIEAGRPGRPFAQAQLGSFILARSLSVRKSK
jgi:hypothetical protein